MNSRFLSVSGVFAFIDFIACNATVGVDGEWRILVYRQSPSIANGKTATPFRDIATGGTLYYPAGSDYSNWLNDGSTYHLGYYGWIGVEK